MAALLPSSATSSPADAPRVGRSLPLSARDLSDVTFGRSAVWETVACVFALHGRPMSVHTRTLRRSMTLRAESAYEFLVPLASVPGWLPDLLAPVPGYAAGATDFEALARVPTDVVERDLEQLERQRPGGHWQTMGPAELIERTADALAVIWRELLMPVWGRVSAVEATDVQERLTGLAQGGLRRALNEVHPSLRFVDAALCVDIGGLDAPESRSTGGICLIPSVFRLNSLVLSVPDHGPMLIGYPAIGGGSIWEPGRGTRRTLGSLIGRTRAAMLAALGEARTTCDLAQEFGLTRSTVNAHLGILAAAGLAHRSRRGKHVHYVRTALGGALLAAEV